MALPFFAITLFISAFLLFLVQPMIGKLILPRLGGTPQVWNTCVMFFQTALLAGYAYTHTLTSRLPTRRQLAIHSALLLLPLPILFLMGGPFGMLREWTPPPGSNPIFSTLLILTIVVGVPFLVVSTTAPLLQRWFAYTGHPASKDPYFLYAASNLGSMLALILYPVLIEPLFDLQSPAFDLGTQTWIWAVGYIFLILLVGGCVFMVLQAPPSVQLAGPSLPEPLPAEAPPTDPSPVTQIKATAPAPRVTTGIRKGSKQRGRTQRPAPALSSTSPVAGVAPAPPRPYELTWWHRLRWVLLAAVPSSLMLGVTTYISTDISAIPLFWVIPLALYLLSFILVFLRWPVVWTDTPHKIMAWVQPLCLLLLIFILIGGGGFTPTRSITGCLVAFFAVALYCHGELARDRPPARHLTEFYLWMSIGGALGGIFNGLLAPVLFVGLLEFYLAIVLAGLVRSKIRSDSWTDNLITSAAPGLMDWFGDKGDAVARNFQGKPTPVAADTPAAARASREGLPERGWPLHYALDILLPVLLGLAFLYVRSKASSLADWNWMYIGGTLESAVRNPLFRFWYNTMALAPNTAVWWTENTYKFLVFGIPLLVCFLYSPRPLRFGLGVGAILLAGWLFEHSAEARPYDVTEQTTVFKGEVHADRSYFGILRVNEEAARKNAKTDDDKIKSDPNGDIVQNFTLLMHGTTYHGRNFQNPKELRRTPTTYYHRFGPVGAVMERLNWFPMARGQYNLDPLMAKALKYNAYSADARLPVSVIGSALSPMPGALGTGVAMMPSVVSAWSEPAYATIGLGTGTMASYGRPFHHVTFYEIDNLIRSFSDKEFRWPDGTVAPFFNYIQDARGRGANVDVIMGDARLAMKQEDPKLTERVAPRSHYYRVIVVDAFSSDAIPVHLITEEAIKMYFEKLVLPQKRAVPVKDASGKVREYYDGGVLCVHTSNRHVDLVQPVTDIARKLGLKWRVGKDQGDRSQDQLPVSLNNPDIGRFGSEYVMLAVNEESLPDETKAEQEGQREPRMVWYTPPAPNNRLWTDNYSNLLGVFRW